MHSSNRRDFLKTVAGTSAALAAAPWARAAAAKRSNILFILTDQWRGSATGYAGDPNVKTPNLDRMAKEALNFCNAVSVCAVCTPARAALMTGRFPTSTGMFLNDAYLPDDELCIAEIFQQAGYATGYIGKWHLDGQGREDFTPRSRRQGWDYWKAVECCHDYNHSVYYANDDPQQRVWDGYDAYAQTKDAQQYLAEHSSGEKPFVLMVSYGTPHFPHQTAPEELKQMYLPKEIKLPPNVPASMRSAAAKEAQGYYAHCTALDRCVGDLFQTVEKTGLDENTIVVFTSDHGESLGGHGVIPTRKHLPFDETARVPFLIRIPNQAGAGTTVRMPLTTPDILPTLLGLSGIPVPSTVEGEDLSAAVCNPAAATDRAALYEAVAPFGLFGPRTKELKKEYRAIRTEQYTYVRNLNGPWMLFDDVNDSYQLSNLVNDPKFVALRKELDGKLQAELDRLNDPFLDRQYYIDLWGYQVPNGRSIPFESGAAMQSPHRKDSL